MRKKYRKYLDEFEMEPDQEEALLAWMCWAANKALDIEIEKAEKRDCKKEDEEESF